MHWRAFAVVLAFRLGRQLVRLSSLWPTLLIAGLISRRGQPGPMTTSMNRMDWSTEVWYKSGEDQDGMGDPE